MTLVVRPYYSRAYGDEFIVVPEHKLEEWGLGDRDPSHRIIARVDGVRPTQVSRFPTREMAEGYVASIEADRREAAEKDPRGLGDGLGR